MHLLIAPDKFKGCLPAKAVAAALERGILQSFPTATTQLHPLADGGDGSLAALSDSLPLEKVDVESCDPLGRVLPTSYLQAAGTAYVELASASGLVLLAVGERNPLLTSTLGTGHTIRAALEAGNRSIYLFLGGSATNDGGIGIAHALGFRFLDAASRPLAPIGANLVKIRQIDTSLCLAAVADSRFYLVCDVTNPLIGPQGAAAVYGPQKGASAGQLALLDEGLAQLAKVLVWQGYPDIRLVAGAAAAGGVGGGLHALLGAKLLAGFEAIANITKLSISLEKADIVLTGEGKLDAQTAQGKVIAGLQAVAQARQLPLIAICGDAEQGLGQQLGLAAVYTVRSRASNLADAMENAATYLEQIGREIGEALQEGSWLEAASKQ